MDFFEFLLVLVGLVGAIAISTLLVYLGHVIRCWDRVERPFLFLTFVAWLLINVIGHITGIWAYRNVELDVYFSAFVIIGPIIFFTLAVTILIPQQKNDTTPIDLDVIYFDSSRAVFVFLTLHVLSALAADFLPGVTDAPPVAFMLGMAIILLCGAFTKSKPTHGVLLFCLLLSQAAPRLT